MKTGKIGVESGRAPAQPRRAQHQPRRRFIAGVMPKDYISADQLRAELQQRVSGSPDTAALVETNAPEKWWSR